MLPLNHYWPRIRHMICATLSTSIFFGCASILVCALVYFDAQTFAQNNGTTQLQLVSARDHIEGNFVTSQSVYADRNRIYLASAQGKLFVLARDPAANFPLLETIQVSANPLTAVRGDNKYLYVTSRDGNLRVYDVKTSSEPLKLLRTIPLIYFGLSSMALVGDRLYVSAGQSQLAADRNNIYLSQINEGELALEIETRTWTVTRTYGETFELNSTVVYDRLSGNRVISIPNPLSLLGGHAQVSLYADQKILVQTIPGCCGSGIYIYDTSTMALDPLVPQAYTNTVARRGGLLIAGMETGQVKVFDLSDRPLSLVSSIDLRQLTGHTGSEDIEIRAMWVDQFDKLIFAASSWGNDQSRGPLLPSFFVLEMK
jgi:WD40 repeat protein